MLSLAASLKATGSSGVYPPGLVSLLCLLLSPSLLRDGLVPPAAKRRHLYASWGLAADAARLVARDIQVSGDRETHGERQIERQRHGDIGDKETHRDSCQGRQGGRERRDEGETRIPTRPGVYYSGGVVVIVSLCRLSLQMSRFFEALVAAGGPPVRSSHFLLNELQRALRGLPDVVPVQ